jgi:4-diphosphocytidyl-2-C-methyl-D-erythritol kinase
MSMRLPGPDYPAPAKLNLFLHVVGRRADGYHLLQTVFTLIDRCDRLRFRARADGAIRRVNDVPGVASQDDLSVRAARLLREASGSAQGADIEIDKAIPIGGGLGGGSSDAATTLIVLDRLWKTGFEREALAELAVCLGADVPYFLFGRPAWAEGIGDRVTEARIPTRWYAVLAPPVKVPTASVFGAPELTRNTEALKMEDFSAQPGDPRFRNDLEPVVVSRFPAVREHLEWLAGHGEARMTGSGGCVFAGFDSREEAARVIDALPAAMNGFVAQGLAHHPLLE